MANTDIQPPTSLRAVVSYIGKYVSKPEKSSVSWVTVLVHDSTSATVPGRGDLSNVLVTLRYADLKGSVPYDVVLRSILETFSV
jgi:hypothetical protein